jgi:hypothetical protein
MKSSPSWSGAAKSRSKLACGLIFLPSEQIHSAGCGCNVLMVTLTQDIDLIGNNSFTTTADTGTDAYTNLFYKQGWILA